MALTEEWRKSSRSGSGPACVEARRTPGGVQVRDTKDRSGPVLAFAPDAWSAFVDSIKAGDFDLR